MPLLTAQPGLCVGLFWTGNVLLLVSALLAKDGGFTDARENIQRRFNVAGKQEALLMESPEHKPSFDPSLQDNVTVELGQTAILPCVVINQGIHHVSWGKVNKHYNIISVGGQILSGPGQYALPHIQSAADWSLQIHHVKFGDAGKYECQIGTSPRKTSRTVILHVHAVPTAQAKTNRGTPSRRSNCFWTIFFANCATLLVRTRIK